MTRPEFSFAQFNALPLKDCTALIENDQHISYATLHQKITQVCSNLEDLGVTSGQRVGVIGKRSADYIVILFSLWEIGAIACPLNPKEAASQITKQLKQLSCPILLSDDKKYIKELSNENLQSYLFEKTLSKNLSKREPLKSDFDFSQPATIIFTSGSSAEPKAALHSLGNHIKSASASNKNLPLKANDRWLLSLPLYHVGGLAILFRCLLAGATIVISKHSKNLNRLMIRDKITHVSLVPTQLQRFFTDPDASNMFKHIKAILLGGAPVPDRLIQTALSQKLPVYITYGLTEMSSQVATTNGNLTNVESKVLDCAKIRISHQGEILVKGAALFLGYVTSNGIERPLTEDSWFQTGDLGTLTGKNVLKVVGRRDNMFISGGENIQPEEIEKYLLELEAIEKAVVVPEAHYDFGCRPVAFIKFDSEMSMPEGQIVSYLRKRVSKYKIPDKFLRWPGIIDHTKSKDNRNELKRLARN